MKSINKIIVLISAMVILTAPSALMFSNAESTEETLALEDSEISRLIGEPVLPTSLQNTMKTFRPPDNILNVWDSYSDVEQQNLSNDTFFEQYPDWNVGGIDAPASYYSNENQSALWNNNTEEWDLYYNWESSTSRKTNQMVWKNTPATIYKTNLKYTEGLLANNYTSATWISISYSPFNDTVSSNPYNSIGTDNPNTIISIRMSAAYKRSHFSWLNQSDDLDPVSSSYEFNITPDYVRLQIIHNGSIITLGYYNYSDMVSNGVDVYFFANDDENSYSFGAYVLYENKNFLAQTYKTLEDVGWNELIRTNTIYTTIFTHRSDLLPEGVGVKDSDGNVWGNVSVSINYWEDEYITASEIISWNRGLTKYSYFELIPQIEMLITISIIGAVMVMFKKTTGKI